MSIPVRSLALLLCAPLSLHSQQSARDTAHVATIVVTATRSPLAAERAPSSVSVLTGAQLRAEGITTVADALRTVPGITVAQTGSYGGATSLFIRGGESKYTKVLIDGVPVNDAGGAFDFASLTTDNIDRIEIVRGPASVLYGSDAVAGVVQLFTRRGTSGIHGELSSRGGTFHSYDTEGSVRGESGGFDFSVGGAQHETRGFQLFNSGYHDNVASSSLGFAQGALDARLAARYSDIVLHYPTDGSGFVVDSNAVRREGRLALGLDAGYRLSPAAELRLALATHAVHGISDNQPDSPGDTGGYYYTTADRSRRNSGDLRLNLDLPAATRLTVGGQIEREWQESGTESSYGPTPTASNGRRNTGGYAQLLAAPTAASTVTVGGRYEHNDQFGHFATWRAAGSVQVADATRLRASVGTAFREPTFLESYGCCGYVSGNPSLEPEHSFSVDAGVERSLGDWGTLGATWFDNSFRNIIDYAYNGAGPDYFNLARTHSAGLELEARATLPAGFHTDAAFTYLATRVVDPGKSTSATALFVPGAHLLRRPAHTLDVGVGYRNGLGAIELRSLMIGTREDNYFGPAPDYVASHVTLPAYARIDLSGELAVVPASAGRGAVIATLRAENLFDARYTDVAGYNFDFQRTDAASLAQTGYRAAGRRVLGGVKLSF
ncbi:MAG: TonB-dependent receptor [Gemmatimonadetes bacterium]|nr:TonB-dependent receptor [Gemmatimonadota bacterium]